jgi:DNA polymerase phi
VSSTFLVLMVRLTRSSDIFFAANASPERKAIGFQVLESMVVTGPTAVLATCFSPKSMKCLINQSANKQRLLHAAATKLLDSMVIRAAADDEAAAAIFSALIQDNGILSFDRLTRTSTISLIIKNCLAGSPGSALSKILDVYQQMILKPGTAEMKLAETTRNTVADHILSVVRNCATSSALAQDPVPHWLEKILYILSGPAHAIQSHHTKLYDPPLSALSRQMFRTRMSSAVAQVLSMMHSSTDALEVLLRVDQNTRMFMDNDHTTATLVDADEKVKHTIWLSSAMLQPGITPEIMTKPQADAITLILAMACFQAYENDADAVNMLEELQEIFIQLQEASKENKAIPQHAIPNIIEIILSFCSQTTALHRRVAEIAFADLAPLLTPRALESILEVLEQREGLAGQQALFGDADEDVEEDDESGEDNESEDPKDDDGAEDGDSSQHNNIPVKNGKLEVVDVDDEDSDVEIANGEIVDHTHDPDSDSVEDVGSSSDSEDDEQGKDELSEFEKKLASILSVPGAGAKDNDDDAESSSSDSSMGSSQMEELDTHISAIFKERAQRTAGSGASTSFTKAQTQRRAKENIINFKNRVLDLLSIWLKQGGYGMDMSLQCIMPMLRCIRTTRESQLRTKTGMVLIEKYLNAAKKKGLPDVSVSLDDDDEGAEMVDSDHENDSKDEDEETSRAGINAPALLRQVLAETLLFPSRDHTKAGSRACLFVSRCLLASSSKTDGASEADARMKIGAIYKQSHAEALRKLGGLGQPAQEEKHDKKSKKDKKGKRAEKAREEATEAKKEAQTQLPDWQEAVWKDWEEFERLTRKST